MAQKLGVFGGNTGDVFLAEMGDKTQIATVAFSCPLRRTALLVVAGTTLGMLIADVPAVFADENSRQNPHETGALHRRRRVCRAGRDDADGAGTQLGL